MSITLKSHDLKLLAAACREQHLALEAEGKTASTEFRIYRHLEDILGENAGSDKTFVLKEAGKE